MSTSAPPPQHTVENAPIIPEATANVFSRLTFGWITPLLSLGYARPLDPPDLYKLQDSRGSAVIADKILASFEKRLARANAYNERLASGDISPGWRAIWWTIKGNRQEREKCWREKDGRKKASLVLAMNDSVAWWFWSGGVLKLLSDTAMVLSPLLVKVSMLKTSYYGTSSSTHLIAGHYQVYARILQPSFLQRRCTPDRKGSCIVCGIVASANPRVLLHASFLLPVLLDGSAIERWPNHGNILSRSPPLLTRSIHPHKWKTHKPYIY